MYRSGVDALTIQFHGILISDALKLYTNLCAESVTSLAADMVSGSVWMYAASVFNNATFAAFAAGQTAIDPRTHTV